MVVFTRKTKFLAQGFERLLHCVELVGEFFGQTFIAELHEFRQIINLGLKQSPRIEFVVQLRDLRGFFARHVRIIPNFRHRNLVLELF